MFDSTLLPSDNTVEENRKAVLDLLKKINDLAASVGADVSAINSAPVTPLTAKVAGNTTYTLPIKTAGTQTILIPASYLVASAGGPFTLTITTGSGTAATVPIAAVGDTILSGDLIFDIYVDSSGNVVIMAWELSGSNASGWYVAESSGDLSQYAASVAIVGGTNYTWTFPRPFVDLNYSSPGGQSRSNTLQITLQENRPTLFTRTTTQMQFNPVALAGAGAGVVDLSAAGRWRT